MAEGVDCDRVKAQRIVESLCARSQRINNPTGTGIRCDEQGNVIQWIGHMESNRLLKSDYSGLQ